MRTILIAVCTVFVFSVAAFGQATSGDYKKYEVFAGYSNGQVDTGVDSGNGIDNFFRDRSSFNGFNVSATGNVNRYFGIKGDVSATYNRQTLRAVALSGTTQIPIAVRTNNSLYNFLGGVQVKDNASNSRLRPFGYALAGAGHRRTKVKSFTCPPNADCSLLGSNTETGLAGAFGGGLDIKINDKFDFRAVKADYNPIRYDGSTQHNIRLGIGIVFK